MNPLAARPGVLSRALARGFIENVAPRAGLGRLLFALVAVSLAAAAEPQTERRYLSGHGPSDAVPWEFSVSAGRRAGERTTIPVPSNWELHGFGTYNYGQEPNKGSERGLYRTRFAVPADWKGRRVRLVFDGVMTDAAVKVNGQPAGPVHQGGFYRFRYDVTPLLKFGAGSENENVLEVDVAKVSANAATELAERGGDYWVFGGIYRPVFLEAVPALYIEHVAIDARADGVLTADVTLGTLPGSARPDGLNVVPERLEAQILDANGQPLGAPWSTPLPNGGLGRLRITTRASSPQLWTAETPHLYSLRIARRRGNEVLHSVTQRFGFRTFEVRDGEGLFLNGQRILLKGVNRHSFRPETGRALNPDDCREDARLIRAMNMNAVRMSHYPPDEAFLDACDELGLYVLDELSGWQHAHDTVVGRLLVREMVERDVNHPSILFWDNGNEGGFNRDLDAEFALYDPQQRRVLHPWDPFGGVDTKHYTSFDDHAKRLQGPNLVMPTEILHALYDGGGGAGLEDYWRATEASKFGAGMFIWDFADEGVVRTDQNGRIDVFSTFAPDGVVGPHFEKEGSYLAIRDVWSPVQIDRVALDDRFKGEFTVHNRFDFTSLAACRFTWKLAAFSTPTGAAPVKTIAEGTATAPAIAPHASGTLALPLPASWRDADVLYLTALDPRGGELWTWSFAAPSLDARAAAARQARAGAAPKVESSGSTLQLSAGPVTATFAADTGELVSVRSSSKTHSLGNGPRLAFARPVDAGKIEWSSPPERADASSPVLLLEKPVIASVVEVTTDAPRNVPYLGFALELSGDGKAWTTVFDGTRRPGDGSRYTFPPQRVAGLRITKLRRSDGQPLALKSVRVGHAPARFPSTDTAKPVVSPGSGIDPATKQPVAWVEARQSSGLDSFRWTMRGDGSLQLDYRYALDGEFVYHGVTFDHPAEKIAAFSWLGEGPYRVWQNRLRGTWLGEHRVAARVMQPGEAWSYPEAEGMFAGVRLGRLETAAGAIELINPTPGVFVRVGTPRISHPNTMVDFPPGDISLLHAIPAIASKFKTPEQSGPTAQPAKAAGRYEGSVVFRFGE